MPEVDSLVRHGAQHVRGHRRVVSLGRQLHRPGEVPLCRGVLAVVERHPPGQARQLCGGGEHVTPYRVVREPAAQQRHHLRGEVLDNGRTGVTAAVPLVDPGEHARHVADGLEVAPSHGT
ncbi:hypothetical protein [Streptomyces sp. NPDC026673]|uniref:hypothetical protein n=1 Tax=Streptomyces sp. NPDC026673 TaxID=3155724 RepID=UPI0033FE77B5